MRKYMLCFVFSLFFMTTAAYASELMFDTFTPGEDLLSKNAEFNGRTSTAPQNAEISGNDHAKAWLKYNGFSEEVFEGGVFYRSPESTPLIQYGASSSNREDLSYTINGNRLDIHLLVNYSYTECSGGDDGGDGSTQGGSNTGNWFTSSEEHQKPIKRLFLDDGGGDGGDGGDGESDSDGGRHCTTTYGTITISLSYEIPPIHPSSIVSNTNISGEVKGRDLRFPFGNLTNMSNRFRYNFDIYLNETNSTQTYFAEVRHMAYKISKDSNHYFAIPVWLAPYNFTGVASRVFVSYCRPEWNMSCNYRNDSVGLSKEENQGYVIALSTAIPVKMIGYDAFGKPRHTITNFTVVPDEKQPDGDMDYLLSSVSLIGILFVAAYLLTKNDK